MTKIMRTPVVRSINELTRGGARGWGWYHRALKKANAPKETALPYDAAVPAPSTPRTRAFLDISIGNATPERLVVELANDVVPQTTENFIKLCTEGFRSSVYESSSYKNSSIHLIQKGTYIVGGDIIAGNGTGGHAALEDGKRYFNDENFALTFSEEGVIGMANAGVNTNASQFFISLKPLPHLNGRNVAFGKVIEGKNLLKVLDTVYCNGGKPLIDVKITDCGKL